MADTSSLLAALSRRGLKALVILTGLALLVMASGWLFLQTSTGHRFIENQINSRSFGAIKAVKIEGLTGNIFDRFSVASIQIEDKDGVWFTAQRATVDWSLGPIFNKTVHIESLDIPVSEISRRPVFEPSSTEDTAPAYRVKLDSASLNMLRLKEPVMGQNAEIELDMSFQGHPSGQVDSTFRLTRLDSPGDRIDVNFSRRVSGDMSAAFDIQGAPGGVINHILQLPNDTITHGSGKLSGSLSNGNGALNVKNGDKTIARLSTQWTALSGSVSGYLFIEDWPLMSPLQNRFGHHLTLAATLEREPTPSQLTVSVTGHGATLKLMSDIDDFQSRPRTAHIELSLQNLSRVAGLPKEYNIGPAQIEGQINLGQSKTFEGTVALQNITTEFGTARLIRGPVIIRQTAKTSYVVETNQNISGLTASKPLPVSLGPSGHVLTTATLNLDQDTLHISNLQMSSGELRLQTKGHMGLQGQVLAFSGNLKTNVNASTAAPPGQLQTGFNIKNSPGTPLTVSLEGAFKPNHIGNEILDGLIGTGFNFVTEIISTQRGMNIRRARVEGGKLQAALRGTVSENASLSGELRLLGPLDIQTLSLPHSVDVSFSLSGPLSAPSIKLDGEAPKILVNTYTFDEPRLRLDITDINGAPGGPVRFDAATPHGDLILEANMVSGNTGYSAENILMHWGQLNAQGNMSVSSQGLATGQLHLKTPDTLDEHIRAELSLFVKDGRQNLAVSASAKNITHDNLDVNALTIDLTGNTEHLQGHIQTDGSHRQAFLTRPFALKMPVQLTMNSGIIDAKLTPEATLGRLELAAVQPVSVTYTNGQFALKAPLSLNGSPVNLDYRQTSGDEQFNFTANDLPVSLFPLPAQAADMRGRMRAALALTLTDGILSGQGQLSGVDFRGNGIAPEQGIDSHINVTVEGQNIDWIFAANSTRSLTAQGDGRVRLKPAESLAAIRLNMTAPVSGSLTAGGNAASLLELFTPSESQPSGQIDLSMDISGTPERPKVDGQITGTDFQFEAPELGTRIRDGRFSTRFSDHDFTVENAVFSDALGGSLEGRGTFKLGELGRPIGDIQLTVRNFTALDRRDVEMILNGGLTYKSRQARSELTGDLELEKTEVKEFVSGSKAVIVIDVEEINKPARAKEAVVRAPVKPLDLDVNIKAPRRLFIRSKGLDVEMALNANIQGTLTKPLIFGEATVLRGGYRLAGKTLELREGRIVFDGDIKDARVDMTAATRTQNLSAEVKVTGRVSEPKITLSSKPERPQDEILSALLFGRSATELSALEAAQLAGALAQFSGSGGGFDLLGGLRDALGVGQLSIGVAENGGAQIKGGRYLAKDVYLEVFSGGSRQQTGAVIEWEIRDNIALRSQIQTDTEQSFSLKWKHDF